MRRAALALLERLADAQDRHQAVAQGRDELARDERVVFPVQGAPLGMADDDVAAADIGEHRGRDLAGMGAGFFRADVLRPEAAWRCRAAAAPTSAR